MTSGAHRLKWLDSLLWKFVPSDCQALQNHFQQRGSTEVKVKNQVLSC